MAFPTPFTQTMNDINTILNDDPEKWVDTANDLDKQVNQLRTYDAQMQSYIDDQIKVLSVLDVEKERLLAKKKNVDLALEGRQRLSVLNENYRLRTAEYIKMILIIAISAFVILAIRMLKSRVPFIPDIVTDLVCMVIAAISFLWCILIYLTIYSRDNIYFNELSLNSPFNTSPNNAPANSVTNSQMTSMQNIYIPIVNNNAPNNDIVDYTDSNVNDCQKLCNDNQTCSGIAFRKTDNRCWLKSSTGVTVPDNDIDLYVKNITKQ